MALPAHRYKLLRPYADLPQCFRIGVWKHPFLTEQAPEDRPKIIPDLDRPQFPGAFLADLVGFSDGGVGGHDWSVLSSAGAIAFHDFIDCAPMVRHLTRCWTRFTFGYVKAQTLSVRGYAEEIPIYIAIRFI